MKKILYVQVVALLGGTLFAWFTVYNDFMRFYDIEGTVFRVKDCIIPNPVTTPCFWGAWAFLIALLWAIAIVRKTDVMAQTKNQKRLVIFLVAGNIFAWSNAARGIVEFYANKAQPTIGCSGLLVTNPFITPCFFGSSLFLLSLLVSFFVIASMGIRAKAV